MINSKSKEIDPHTFILHAANVTHCDCDNYDCCEDRNCGCGVCGHFTFIEGLRHKKNAFENKVMPYLRANNDLAEMDRMGRGSRTLTEEDYETYDEDYSDDGYDSADYNPLRKIKIDKLLPLESYRIGLINDVIDEYRHGRTGYVFDLGQVRDVLRFLPDAKFAVRDGIYYVSK